MKYNRAYILLSPAKINLFLKVLNKREDGYHNILSAVQKISLFDIIKIRILKNNKGLIKVLFSNTEISPVNNTVYNAVKYFKEQFNLNDSIEIFIKKEIPVEAGLGGGSSNAGIVLKFLNKFYSEPFNIEKLISIAKKIGADVPLFVSNKNLLLMGGIGDKLFDYDLDLSNYLILIVKPNFSISTKSVYKNLNLELTNKFKSINRAPSQISEFFNDLENVVLEYYPEIENIKKFMYKNGASLSLMTGSGSAVFGLFNSREKALYCIQQLDAKYEKFLLNALD